MADKAGKVLKKLRKEEVEAADHYDEGASLLEKEGDEEGASLLKHIRSEERHHKKELEEHMADNRAKVHLGGPKKATKKTGKKRTVHKMHIRRTANGGYIAEHEFKSEPGATPVENEEHHVPDLNTLQAHVGEYMASPREEEEETKETPPAAAPGQRPELPIGV
jgi:hypothetical protein